MSSMVDHEPDSRVFKKKLTVRLIKGLQRAVYKFSLVLNNGELGKIKKIQKNQKTIVNQPFSPEELKS
uniref:Cystatin domain-containing protein n=1 Tax=Caenorhabditis tropicalis TaxID=1561998 RepID=A0A1I7V3R3_9PELO